MEDISWPQHRYGNPWIIEYTGGAIGGSPEVSYSRIWRGSEDTWVFHVQKLKWLSDSSRSLSKASPVLRKPDAATGAGALQDPANFWECKPPFYSIPQSIWAYPDDPPVAGRWGEGGATHVNRLTQFEYESQVSGALTRVFFTLPCRWLMSCRVSQKCAFSQIESKPLDLSSHLRLMQSTPKLESQLPGVTSICSDGILPTYVALGNLCQPAIGISMHSSNWVGVSSFWETPRRKWIQFHMHCCWGFCYLWKSFNDSLQYNVM